MPKSNLLGKNSISFHFSHKGFVEKTNCKLSVSNGSANALSKMKNIFLLMGVGRWDRRALPSWILKFDIFELHFWQKKVVFQFWEGKM